MKSYRAILIDAKLVQLAIKKSFGSSGGKMTAEFVAHMLKDAKSVSDFIGCFEIAKLFKKEKLSKEFLNFL